MVVEGVTFAMRQLNLKIPDGNTTDAPGPRGCGKTTLLKTIARLIADSGEVRYENIDRKHVPHGWPACRYGFSALCASTLI
jgi:ABC-type cobalamin/Fe3+-siderophores transport system ATPase subunit